MRDTVIATLCAALVLLALDMLWLKLAMGPLYQRTLGPILLDPPAIAPAAAFYLLYIAGVVFFAIRPAVESGDWRQALLRGAALGLLAYGTYDLTNLTTLKAWSLRLSLMDMAWGTFLTATAASVSTAITLALEK